MLSNIFLHYVLDEWMEQVVKPRLRGKAFLIRYADDFVMGSRTNKTHGGCWRSCRSDWAKRLSDSSRQDPAHSFPGASESGL